MYIFDYYGALKNQIRLLGWKDVQVIGKNIVGRDEHNFYSYELKNGNKTGTVSLTAIPILFVWSMAITKRLNVFAGVGSYFMTTHLHYDSKVTSGALGLGFNVSVNYIQPVSSKFGIGAEIKWTEATQTRDYGLSAHLMLEWKFFEW